MRDLLRRHRIVLFASSTCLASRVASLWFVVALAACGRSSAGEDPARQPPEPVRFDRPAMVQFHMRQHFADLRVVERSACSLQASSMTRRPVRSS
jgi:hypothetical protein